MTLDKNKSGALEKEIFDQWVTQSPEIGVHTTESLRGHWGKGMCLIFPLQGPHFPLHTMENNLCGFLALQSQGKKKKRERKEFQVQEFCALQILKSKTLEFKEWNALMSTLKLIINVMSLKPFLLWGNLRISTFCKKLLFLTSKDLSNTHKVSSNLKVLSKNALISLLWVLAPAMEKGVR